jgi:uncharacterized protein DUF4255
MADQLDERLRNWIANEIEGAEISLAAPAKERPGRGVSLYLLELMPFPAPRTDKRPPLQLSLKYLVTAWSERPEDAHEILVHLMFAAMEDKDFQVDLEPIPLTAWTAMGVPPQPSFVLRVPLRQERPEAQTKLVRYPLEVQSSPIVGFHGVLLGPGDVPLSQCQVEIPDLNLATRTDYKGRFCFPNVPAAGAKQLLIKAKGLELPISSEQNYPDRSAPLVIHFSLLEE